MSCTSSQCTSEDFSVAGRWLYFQRLGKAPTYVLAVLILSTFFFFSSRILSCLYGIMVTFDQLTYTNTLCQEPVCLPFNRTEVQFTIPRHRQSKNRGYPFLLFNLGSGDLTPSISQDSPLASTSTNHSPNPYNHRSDRTPTLENTYREEAQKDSLPRSSRHFPPRFEKKRQLWSMTAL